MAPCGSLLTLLRQCGGCRRAGETSSITIPSLANASRPNDLDFTAGECDVDAARQDDGVRVPAGVLDVVATRHLHLPRHDEPLRAHVRARERDALDRAARGPLDACGVLDIATLDNGGATRWTMELREEVTAKDARCRAPAAPEILSWQNVIRPLPCTRIQPGAMSR